MKSVLVILLFGILSIQAQDSLVFRLDESNGLSNNFVYDLEPTRENELYIATDNGLTIINANGGLEYINSTDGLLGNNITALMEYNQYILAASYRLGINIIAKSTQKIIGHIQQKGCEHVTGFVRFGNTILLSDQYQGMILATVNKDHYQLNHSFQHVRLQRVINDSVILSQRNQYFLVSNNALVELDERNIALGFQQNSPGLYYKSDTCSFNQYFCMASQGEGLAFYKSTYLSADPFNQPGNELNPSYFKVKPIKNSILITGYRFAKSIPLFNPHTLTKEPFLNSLTGDVFYDAVELNASYYIIAGDRIQSTSDGHTFVEVGKANSSCFYSNDTCFMYTKKNSLVIRNQQKQVKEILFNFQFQRLFQLYKMGNYLVMLDFDKTFVLNLITQQISTLSIHINKVVEFKNEICFLTDNGLYLLHQNKWVYKGTRFYHAVSNSRYVLLMSSQGLLLSTTNLENLYNLDLGYMGIHSLSCLGLYESKLITFNKNRLLAIDLEAIKSLFDINYVKVSIQSEGKHYPGNVQIKENNLPSYTLRITDGNRANVIQPAYYVVCNGHRTEINPNEKINLNQFATQKTNQIQIYAEHPSMKDSQLLGTYEIKIIYPWYKRQSTFVVLTIILLLLTLSVSYMVITQQKNKFHKKLEQHQQINKFNQISYLKLMQPHFISNTLNTIKGLVYLDEKDNALENIDNLSLLLRKVLKDTAHNSTTVREEIDFIKKYIAIERTRFQNDIQFKVILGKSVDPKHTHIPSFFIQPLVENAIYYGSMEEPVLLKIKKGKQGTLRIQVKNKMGAKNKLPGYKDDSYSLQIIQERLKILSSMHNLVLFHELRFDENMAISEIVLPILSPQSNV